MSKRWPEVTDRSSLSIKINDFIDSRNYKENITEYIESFIKELKNSWAKELAMRIESSQIEVEFTWESSRKRWWEKASFNQTKTQDENSKWIKSIIINVKSRWNWNQVSVFRLTFVWDNWNILSADDLEKLKSTLIELDKKAPEKIRRVISETSKAHSNIIENPIIYEISTIADAVELIQWLMNESWGNELRWLSGETEAVWNDDAKSKEEKPKIEEVVLDEYELWVLNEWFDNFIDGLISKSENLWENGYFISEWDLNALLFESYSISKAKLIKYLQNKWIIKKALRKNHTQYERLKLELKTPYRNLWDEIKSDTKTIKWLEEFQYISNTFIDWFELRYLNRGSETKNRTFTRWYIISL